MELRELRYFLAIAQEQSITKAADYLYITQPSLSRQMQNLEKEIGRPLFERGSRKIVLTETGQLLKKHAEEMIALYDKTKEALAAPPDDVTGEIYIGGGESYAVSSVARVMRDMQNAYPDVRFTVYSGDSGDVKEKLDKGLIDFGIFVDRSDLTGYNTIRLPLTDVWGVLMKTDSPLAGRESVTAEDLKDLPLICSVQSLRPGSRLREWFGGDVSTLNIKCRYNLIYNASLLVREGLGYAVGLDRLVNTESGDLCFRPLSPALETHLDIAWKKYTAQSRAVQLFIDRLSNMTA